jgi:hypothetical protein
VGLPGNVIVQPYLRINATGCMVFIVEVGGFPAAAVKLVKERFLDVVAFVEPQVLGCCALGHDSAVVF